MSKGKNFKRWKCQNVEISKGENVKGENVKLALVSNVYVLVSISKG
jgi:hypothetical protein